MHSCSAFGFVFIYLPLDCISLLFLDFSPRQKSEGKEIFICFWFIFKSHYKITAQLFRFCCFSLRFGSVLLGNHKNCEFDVQKLQQQRRKQSAAINLHSAGWNFSLYCVCCVLRFGASQKILNWLKYVILHCFRSIVFFFCLQRQSQKGDKRYGLWVYVCILESSTTKQCVQQTIHGNKAIKLRCNSSQFRFIFFDVVCVSPSFSCSCF